MADDIGDWNVGGPASGGSGRLKVAREAWEALELAADPDADITWMADGPQAGAIARMAECFLRGGLAAPPIRLGVDGLLSALSPPAPDLASDLAVGPATYTTFQATRGVPESSGTTAIALELDGVLVEGGALSWTSADAAFAVKQTVVAVNVVAGSRLSLRVTSAGVDAETVVAKVS